MGRGLAQRRRAANFMKAKKERGAVTDLPPPPAKDDGAFMPRSLRQMLQQKARLDRQQVRKPKVLGRFEGGAERLHSNVFSGSPALQGPLHHVQSRRGVQIDSARGLHPATPSYREGQPADGSAALATEDAPQGPAAQESAGQQTMASREGVSPGRRHVDAAASTVPGTAAEKAAPGWPQHRHAQSHDRALKALFTPKTLKPRKKEYLKRRKLKRKGSLAGDGSSKEEELEASLAARDVKPAFGEVAKQPLKFNLKRKHWEKIVPAQTANQRMGQVFTKQMEMAAARANQQERLQEITFSKPPRTGSRSHKQHDSVVTGDSAPRLLGMADGVAKRTGKTLSTKKSSGWQARRDLQVQQEERKALRETMIAAYRGQKKGQAGQPQSNGANMQSLASLVRKERQMS